MITLADLIAHSVGPLGERGRKAAAPSRRRRPAATLRARQAERRDAAAPNRAQPIRTAAAVQRGDFAHLRSAIDPGVTSGVLLPLPDARAQQLLGRAMRAGPRPDPRSNPKIQRLWARAIEAGPQPDPQANPKIQRLWARAFGRLAINGER